MKITRDKHAGFIVESDGRRLGVDLGEFTSAETTAALNLNALAASHGHADHYTAANAAAAAAPVAAPSDVVALLPNGIKAYTLRLGETLTLAGFEITPTLADHGPKLSRPIENFGLVIERAGRRIYYTGDMAVATPPPDGPFDLVLVPVEGGGFVFDPEQAIAFVHAMGHRGMVVPIHDGDPAASGCVEHFERLAEVICKAVVLKPGESVEV